MMFSHHDENIPLPPSTNDSAFTSSSSTAASHLTTKSNEITNDTPHTTSTLHNSNQLLDNGALQLTHLDDQTKHLLLLCLTNYLHTFKFDGDKLGKTSLIKHVIFTESEIPIAKPPYRLPHAHRSVLRQMIDDLLQEEIISHSTSPWSAPVILIPKKNTQPQQFRLVVDYRALNAVTQRDFFPLPTLQDTLDVLGSAKLFTTLDCASGYYHIPLDDSTKHKTAFSTIDGHYEWNVMPFGLCNAPSTWQRFMYAILQGLTNRICLVYLDDILIFSGSDIKEHLHHVSLVLDRLTQHNLKLNPDKCKFLTTSTKYLGHIITTHGIQPDPDKINVIHQWPTPNTLKKLKSFLGLIQFYKRFIPRLLGG